MSDCDKCECNTIHGYCSCVLYRAQVDTSEGIRSKILGCPKFIASTKLDYAMHDQTGGSI